MSNSATNILCFAQGGAEPALLLVRRQFIQTRVGGRRVAGVIPDWAGQWGCIAGQPMSGQTIVQGAYAVFLAQTGIDLADPQTAAAYGMDATSAQDLQDANYNPVPTLYVRCTASGLASLARDIQGKLQDNQPAEGVLLEAQVKRLSEAKSLIGPVPPPPDGWRNFLIRNHWGGKAPGQLNTEIDALTATIAANTAARPTGFLLALDSIPRHHDIPIPTPVPPASVIQTYTMIANNNPYPIRISASIANAADWASTTNRPDKTFAGVAIDLFDQASGEADLVSSAASAKVQVAVTIEGEQETLVFDYDQRAALSQTDMQALGVFGKTRKFVVTQSSRTTSQGKPELILVITESEGD